MSFPKYGEYKDSGVEWLGAVPEHWIVTRLGALFRQVDEEGDDDLPILSVSIHDGVSDKELNEKELDRKVTRSEDRSKYKKVEPGDLVYNMMRAWQGGFGSVEIRGMVSPAYVVARPVADFSTGFIEKLLRTPQAVEQMRRLSHGVTDFRLRLYWDEFKSIRVVIPPKIDLEAISDFLDQETAKIDALMREQRRLIELLKDKRQAVISHAVTKGLNPHAPMKPSGIEWLGQIPDHWQLTRLKYVTLLNRGIQMGPFGGMLKNLNQTPSQYKLYGQENTISNNFEAGSRWLNNEHFGLLQEYELVPGDIVLTRKGASIGYCRIVPEGIQPGVIDSDTIRVRIDSSRVSVEFAALLMHEGYMESAILEQQKGAVLPGLNSGTIANLLIAVPPIEEQREILDYVSVQLSKLDALTAAAQRAVDLLQERRIALISAAVTGKIDVRGLADLEAR